MITQAEIQIPSQPPETSKFKRREECFWRQGGIGPFRNVRIVEHYDFESTYRVRDGFGEVLVHELELFTGGEMREQIELEDRLKYQDVIFMWNAGLKTAKQMGEKTKTKSACWVSKIRAAKEEGL